jgi:hypothetical protein
VVAHSGWLLRQDRPEERLMDKALTDALVLLIGDGTQ